MELPRPRSWLARLTSSRRRVVLGGLVMAIVLVLLPLACTRLGTRFEDHVTLSRGSAKTQDWMLNWGTIARRGVNLVDSSGNVGSASATFPCRAHPDLPSTWTVSGKATHWAGSGAAADVLGPPATGAWHGTVTVETTAEGKALVIDLHDQDGRAFVGNRRYGKSEGNGEIWVAR